MVSTRTIGICLSVLLLTGSAWAQEDMPEMTPEQMAEMQAYMAAGTPGAPHREMASHAGSYDVKVLSWSDPAAPPMESTGTATRKLILDGRVMTETFEGSMMGAPFSGYGTSGYDNVSQKHWSTWMDSMSTGMMASEGTCDAKGTCTFVGSWNDPVTKGPKETRMTTRWTSPTVELFEMYGEGRDGKEFKMMQLTYTKK